MYMFLLKMLNKLVISSVFTKIILYPLIMFIPLISFSIDSWVVMWMLMEIGTLSFVILMSLESSFFIKWQSSMSYFLIQAFSSSMFIPFLFMTPSEFITNSFIINFILIMKLGLVPFHSWVPSLMNNMSWNSCFILTTLQKIIPLNFLYKFIIFKLIIVISLISVIIAGCMIIKSTSMKKIMAYSSISNSGWMILILNFNYQAMLGYLMIYSFLTFIIFLLFNKLNLNLINDFNKLNLINFPFKLSLIFLMLSIGGLPPFVGFIMKLTAISSLKMSSFMLMFMIILSLINIWWYIIICMTFFLNFEPSTKTWMNLSSSPSTKIILIMSISIMVCWLAANLILMFN